MRRNARAPPPSSACAPCTLEFVCYALDKLHARKHAAFNVFKQIIKTTARVSCAWLRGRSVQCIAAHSAPHWKRLMVAVVVYKQQRAREAVDVGCAHVKVACFVCLCVCSPLRFNRSHRTHSPAALQQFVPAVQCVTYTHAHKTFFAQDL